MTMISQMGFKPIKKKNVISSILKTTDDITIIIPVKNNQNGINLFLSKFFNLHKPNNFPKEIIIVDNNSIPPIRLNGTFPIPVILIFCAKQGSASARNAGVKQAKTEWILFTDSDCVPTENILTAYFNVQNGSVGYAGNVKALGNDRISRYYEKQEILIPPKVNNLCEVPSPNYLITANCMVWKPAFDEVEGFNEKIQLAGGEDIDLGFKLLQIGQLAYAFDSVVLHDFGRGMRNFKERFIRYGRGNRIVGDLYKLELRPKPFKPNQLTLVHFILAFIQYLSLLYGFKTSKKELVTIDSPIFCDTD